MSSVPVRQEAIEKLELYSTYARWKMRDNAIITGASLHLASLEKFGRTESIVFVLAVALQTRFSLYNKFLR